MSSTVLVLAHDPEKNVQRQASGFFVSDQGDIITNYHVVEGVRKVAVQTTDGKIYPVTKIVAKDSKSDLVRLAVKLPDKSVITRLKVSKSLPEVGMEVVVIGNPAGQRKVISSGIISSLHKVPNFGVLLQTTAPISYGSSGSPVLNTQGEVIGVATFKLFGGLDLNFAIPSGKILALKNSEGTALDEWQGKEGYAIAEKAFMEGKRALEEKDYERAVLFFEKYVEKNPVDLNAWKRWEVWFYIGRCKGELGSAVEAAEAFRQAIEVMPDFAVTHYNLGVAYSSLGRFGEALQAYKQAIHLSPQYAEAHYNLGLTCMALRNSRCAMAEYNVLARLNQELARTFLDRIHR